MNATDRNSNPVPPLGWTPTQTEPVTDPHQTPQPPVAPTAAPKGESAESWIGRTALGVIAAVLVFMGIAYFGTALIPQLSDITKTALMFGLSVALMAVGGILATRRKSMLASALMGCGACSLFASVLIARVSFSLYGDMATYAMLLAWLAVCMALSRAAKSPFLAVIVQVSFALSVLFGYVNDTRGNTMALLLAYQAAATVIVVGATALLHRKMLRPSLVLAMVLNMTTSLFAQGCFDLLAPLDPTIAAGALSLQLVTAAVLAGMMAKTALDDHAKAQCEKSSSQSATPWLIVAALAWFAAVKLDAQYALGYCLEGFLDATAIRLAAAGVAAMLTALAAGLLAWYAHRRQLPISDAPVTPAFVILAIGTVLEVLEVAIEGGSAWTVCCMICALACIVAGFRFRIDGLRLCGLIAVLACVVKLVLFDVDTLDPTTRVIALVIGGIICFAASALYTRAHRRTENDVD